MAKVYREVGITVGMGEYPTNFTTAVIDVMTENDIVKLLVEFPPKYETYRKIIDIGYTTSSQIYTVESYEMSYSDDLEMYFFFIGRKFSYGEIVYLQFRCLYEDGQESVDATILKLRFRPALRLAYFQSYENNDLEEQSEILEKLVIQHANVNASTMHTGHIMIDGTTVLIDENGILSAAPETSADEQIAQISLDIQANKTILDSNGYVHGVFTLRDENLLYYYTNKPKHTSGIKRMEIFPTNLAGISMYQPDTPELERTWAGSYRGTLYKFDLSSIPEGTSIVDAKLAADIRGIDFIYDPGPVYVPGEVEIHLIGSETEEPDLFGIKTISNMDIEPIYTATEYIIIPDIDGNYIRSNYPNDVRYDMGPWVETWNPAPAVYRGLMKFDLSHIPETAIITEANFIADCIWSYDYPLAYPHVGDFDITVHRITGDWNPYTVTWNNQPSFVSTPLTSFKAIEMGNSLEVNLTTEVSNICEGSVSNKGWLIKLANEVPPATFGEGRGNDYENISLEVTANIPVIGHTIAVWNESGELKVENNLFQFDLDALIGNVIVTSATLILTANSTENISSRSINLHKIQAFWDEDTLTWEDRPAYDSTPSATFVEIGTGVTVSIDVTEDVADMIGESIPNYGWYMKYASESLPPIIDEGYRIAFSAPRLVMNVIAPSDWYEKTVTWDIISNKISPIIVGTFAATGVYNVSTADMTDVVNQWTDIPECNNGIYLKCEDTMVELYDYPYVDVAEFVFSSSGFVPRLIIEYTDEEEPEDNGWKVWPIIGHNYNYPGGSDNSFVLDSYPDITVKENGIVQIIFPSDKLNIVNCEYPLPTEAAKTGYIITTIDDEEIRLNSFKSAVFDTEEDMSNLDPKIVTIETGTSYIFVKTKVGGGDGYKRYIEVYSDSEDNEYTFTKEYTSLNPVTSISYSKTIPSVVTYMGGEAKTIGNNVYFVYTTCTEQSNVLNPRTGSNESVLRVSVRMISRVGGVWNEELLFDYAPLFGIYYYNHYSTFQGFLLEGGATGYPFGFTKNMNESSDTIYPETFLVNLAVNSDSEIAALLPTWKEEYSGIMDLLILKYNGTEWSSDYLRMSEWGGSARNSPGWEAIEPISMEYNINGDLHIIYSSIEMHTSWNDEFFGQARHAKYDDGKWTFVELVSEFIVFDFSPPFGYGKMNLIKQSNGQFFTVCSTEKEIWYSLEVGIRLVKRLLER